MEVSNTSSPPNKVIEVPNDKSPGSKVKEVPNNNPPSNKIIKVPMDNSLSNKEVPKENSFSNKFMELTKDNPPPEKIIEVSTDNSPSNKLIEIANKNVGDIKNVLSANVIPKSKILEANQSKLKNYAPIRNQNTYLNKNAVKKSYSGKSPSPTPTPIANKATKSILKSTTTSGKNNLMVNFNEQSDKYSVIYALSIISNLSKFII